jgi:hypothetical protein
VPLIPALSALHQDLNCRVRQYQLQFIVEVSFDFSHSLVLCLIWLSKDGLVYKKRKVDCFGGSPVVFKSIGLGKTYWTVI